ncbi:membrane-spanning 4-domains subfamily A member 4A-like [Bufo gargarizans]|uniref:membrane-spanning 4-domains subfamily A member 4A-like n=1 Tax=Bufo gargarizans TaxID=30331 RepID=UPI001CF30A2A|nr:membrane-spanning 4-domains subfamily A member 4A-like [Bufo gargarizans]
MTTNANMQSIIILQHAGAQNVQSMEPQEERRNDVPADMPKPLVKFFKGEPEVLGVTQLFTGINSIFFGIILTMMFHKKPSYYISAAVVTGVCFWSGVAYIISGSLSIAASCKPSLGKVNASLVLNIISCVTIVPSVVIFAIFLSEVSSIGYRYSYSYSSNSSSSSSSGHNYCAYYKQSQTCEGEFALQSILLGVGAILLLFTALEFCIALSTSIFGCKTACRTSYNDMAVVIYHTTTVNDSKPALA